jgi:hypothetical protein
VVSLFDLANTLGVNTFNFFESVGDEVITLCVDIGQQLSVSTPLSIVAWNCLFGIGHLFYTLSPVWLPFVVLPHLLNSCAALLLLENRRATPISSRCGVLLEDARLMDEKPFRPEDLCAETHRSDERLEPIMDENAFPPEDLYVETHTCTVRVVVRKYYRTRDDMYVDQEVSYQQKYYKVDKVCSMSCSPLFLTHPSFCFQQRHGHHSRFTETEVVVEDPDDEVCDDSFIWCSASDSTQPIVTQGHSSSF